jgi:hypothetical protein
LEYSKSRIVSLLSDVLESARMEVVRRMHATNQPLSFEIQELTVLRNPAGDGWNTDVEIVQVGGLYDNHSLIRIGDDTVPLMTLGLREQLTSLAEYLAEVTDLATRRYAQFSGSDQSLVDVLLTRCVSPLALYYLRSLRDLGISDHNLVLRLAEELDRLISSDVIVHVNHLPVAGTHPEGLYAHRGVSIRSLTPREQGAWVEANARTESPRLVRDSDYMPFAKVSDFMPSALVEITTTRPTGQQFDTSQLPNRIVLAFFLKGYDLATSGFRTNFDWPSWAAMGRWNTPFTVAEKPHFGPDVPLKIEDFKGIVDLAYKMPDFSGREASGREIVLYRVLRALGTRPSDSAFLDLVIALETALLTEATTELSYKFSLYGALYLRDEYDPRETFNRLKNIYRVRSKLVHEGRITPDASQKANRDASELARVVTRKAIESGWPEPKALDLVALE